MEAFFSDFFDLVLFQHKEFIAAFEGLPPEALDWIPGADMNSLCVGDVAMQESSNRDRAAERSGTLNTG